MLYDLLRSTLYYVLPVDARNHKQIELQGHTRYAAKKAILT